MQNSVVAGRNGGYGGGAAAIEFREATKRYAGQPRYALDHLTLRVEPGEICVLVGPSGGGKTTAMKMVNRLVDFDSGDVLLDDTSVRELDATQLRRHIGYVIQQVGLFPHMTVAGNVAVVPDLLGWGKTRIRERVDELLDLMGLDPAEYRERYPTQLSGGQRQRVGIARALAGDPEVLLMDEPFGALDPITRARLQDEFLRLQESVRKTVLFVTHDIDEAVRVGDRIAILREGGVLAQYDTPNAVLAHPADEFVARLVGADRGLKLLSLHRVDEVQLEPAELASDDDPRVEASATLRDALSVILSEAASRCVVVDGVEPLGSLSLDRIADLLGSPVTSEPVIPDFGTGSDCVVENRFFCWDWTKEHWDDTFQPALIEHIKLTLIAVSIGFVIAFVLAYVAYRMHWLETPIGWLSGFLYTIPSLALFQLLVPVTGLSITTVEVALVSYTLLVLFRNTLEGLRAAPPDVREAARAMGLSSRQAFLRVELPLAMPAIMAGLRIAVVLTISLATVGAFVVPEGLGAPIFSGLREFFQTKFVVAGALAVALALVADVLLVLAGRALTPWARARRPA